MTIIRVVNVNNKLNELLARIGRGSSYCSDEPRGPDIFCQKCMFAYFVLVYPRLASFFVMHLTNGV